MSGIVFPIDNASVPEMCPLHSEPAAIFDYHWQETGGQYFSVPPDRYSTVLEEILRQLHPCCQLGFRPRTARSHSETLMALVCAPTCPP
jgi:hypothetical protein